MSDLEIVICDLLDLVNALEDSIEMIKSLYHDCEDENMEYTRGYISALSVSSKMVHDLVSKYIEFEVRNE